MSFTEGSGQRGRAALVLAVPLLAGLLAACGSTTIKTVTDTTTAPAPAAATGTSTAPVPEEPPGQATAQVAKVGDAITLKGYDGVEMKVQVIEYIDPATHGEFSAPEPGARYVGVKFRLTNVGKVAYSDSPGNGSALITNTDEQADSTLVFGGNCEEDTSVKIAPGASRVVCIPFEIPAAQKGKTFQFTLNSGFADETGEWSLQ